MSPSTSSPVHASVAYVRIPHFDTRTVAEQAAIKGELETRARSALAAIPAADRVVLDAEDGLALVLFGPPGRALDATAALQEPGTAGFVVGINHGPLALTSGGSDARVYGDGLAAAAAAARFATPGRPLVTEDFARALSAREPGRGRGLAPAGNFTDTRVRLHSLYTPDPSRAARLRREALRAATLGIVAILLLGTAARFARQLLLPPPPAVVTFAIKPRGDVFVDGAARGRSPPLARLELPAGRHVVVVRHPGYRPLELTLDLEAGQRMAIEHTFVSTRPAEPRGGFWRDLRRRVFGS
ncbi:MAG TPA: PEGA domain-containing protein [Usitatibacter sp.]|nr:PEGA domain-containing protein [Usitatibacter sp.]